MIEIFVYCSSQIRLHSLEHSDDALECAAEMSRRMTMIVADSRERMGLQMACKKCKVLWIQLAELVGPTTPEDVAALGLRYNCECGKPFACSFGLTTHRRTCIAANEVMELLGMMAVRTTT